MISAPSNVNNKIHDASVHNTSSQAMQQSKSTKKASQDVSPISLQPTQSSLMVLTPAAVMLPATPYIPIQHANSLYHTDETFCKVVPTQQAQARPLPSSNPSCSSMGYICRYRKALYSGSLGISLYLELFCFLSFISFVLRKLT